MRKNNSINDNNMLGVSASLPPLEILVPPMLEVE